MIRLDWSARTEDKKGHSPSSLLPYIWGTLLLHVIAHPALESWSPEWDRYCLGVVDTFLVAMLAMLVSRAGLKQAHAVLLASGALLLTWTGIAVDETSWKLVGSLSRVLLYSISVGLILRWILQEQRTVGVVIHGVVGIYLLLGLSWATIYGLSDLIFTSAFQGIQTESDYTYFSLATLTTLGYGDIVPAHAVTRALAGLEAASGVLFATVFVASIVGSVRSQPTGERLTDTRRSSLRSPNAETGQDSDHDY